MKNVRRTVGKNKVGPARAARSEECVEVGSKIVKAFSCAKAGELTAEVVSGGVKKSCVSCIEVCK